MPSPPPPANSGRPFVGVHLKCCHVYVRAYLNSAGDAYVGFCPRCASQVRLRVVKDGGSTGRFFEAS
jgi:hypothetical protein